MSENYNDNFNDDGIDYLKKDSFAFPEISLVQDDVMIDDHPCDIEYALQTNEKIEQVKKICDYVQVHPIFTISEACQSLLINKNTVRCTLKVLMWMGLLSKANKTQYEWIDKKGNDYPIDIADFLQNNIH